MKLPDWNKKQIILIGVLLGTLLCAAVVLIAVLSRPAPATPVSADEPEPEAKAEAFDEPDPLVEDEEIELIEEDGVVSPKSVPTPPPDLVLDFRPDEANPMPEDGAVLPLGQAYTIGGTVRSNYPLSSITVSISCAHNNKSPYPYRKTVHFKNSEIGVCSLNSTATDEGVSLSSLVDFTALQVGVHTLKVSAAVRGTRSIELFRCQFYLVGDEWETISRERFPDSYPEALAFFGSTDRFLFRYQWVNGRYILADPEWEKTYITEIAGYPDASPWRVHVDAVPYFEQTFDYLETSYVRVHGSNGDTGLLKASALITEYNGCYVSRFTSSLKAISHHSFGTAVDLNASMEPNKNSDKNTALIDNDVKEHLVYNGIKTENGVPYYDFTYDGSYRNDPNGVPQTCVNYLLSELGFFRAGFDWAHDYKSTSDAMHFCLSEFVTYKHEDPQYGLRKVFEYAEPVSVPTPPPPEDDIPSDVVAPVQKPYGTDGIDVDEVTVIEP